MHHIHLDPLGGLAGDMFVAALLQLRPAETARTLAAASAVSGANCRVVEHGDGVLTGLRFTVETDDHHPHHHTHWSQIRARLEAAELPDPVRHHAVAIFAGLAEAEGRVHGVAAGDVVFHEVGAADSIADIVAAAWLIAALEPASWSVSPLPIGSGRVQTAHGIMPVPAPATALLLEGFATHDDRIPGERVTPTGAAILRHLAATRQRPPGTLLASGFGFGTRRLPGISNCLRALAFETEADAGAEHRDLAVITFEVDDQSGEDLAAGLERVRATEGVHDVLQMAALGKKGRMAVHVQILARPDALERAVEASFTQTTTIGLRINTVQGRALTRRFVNMPMAEQEVRVKIAQRPHGVTAKAEADHVAEPASHAARAELRHAAEQWAKTR
jgi:uncharacterized protein (TIGR00299 family) protein